MTHKMDHEKKCDELLDRVKGLIDNAKLLGNIAIRVEILEYSFPELREREDERIKKALIEMVQGTTGDDLGLYYDIRKEDAIEWLERQCESVKIKKDKNYLCIKTHKYAGVEWRDGIKYYAIEDYSLVNQGCTYCCPAYSKEEHNEFFIEVE